MRKIDKPYIVYMHIAPNNKRYIGTTCQTLNGRSKLDGSGYRGNKRFWEDIKKYGWSNFQHIIVKNNLSQEDAWNTEIRLIKKYNTTNIEYGYNISIGGNRSNYGIPCSSETRQKISAKNHGKVRTDEEKQQISNKLKGKPHTLEHNKKVSESLKGKYVGEFSPVYGLKRSEETKKRMSTSAKIAWEKRRAKLYESE